MPERKQWTADREVDLELARALVARQHPDLGALEARPFAEGWDNALFLFGAPADPETWVFRFPRREVAVPLMRTELGPSCHR